MDVLRGEIVQRCARIQSVDQTPKRGTKPNTAYIIYLEIKLNNFYRVVDFGYLEVTVKKDNRFQKFLHIFCVPFLNYDTTRFHYDCLFSLEWKNIN